MKRTALAIALLLSSILSGCRSDKRDDRNTLVIAFKSSPTNLDARVGNDNASGRIFDLIYSGLVRLTPQSDYAPDIAEKWETPDPRTIVFHLNPSAKFQDGRPVTADDVKWTYDSLMDPNFKSGKKAGYAAVDHIEAPDSHTVIFKLKEPNGGLFADLMLGILPKGSDTAVFKTRPIGAGPYRVVEFTPDDRVVLEAFDQWHLGAPKIKRIIVRIIPDETTRVLELRKGSVNFSLNNVPNDTVIAFQRNPDFKVAIKPGAIYQYLAFNLRDPILKKKEVREAIAYAIDRDKIVRDLQKGYAAVTETMLPPGHWAHADGLPTHPFDPAKAKQLLDDAGYPDPDGDGPRSRFKLVFKTSTDAEANQRAEMIQEMLAQVGIEIVINSSEFGTFYDDIQKGNFQIYSLSRNGIVDPDFYQVVFHSKSLPPEGQNRGYYINPKVDQLIEAGRASFDENQRRPFYIEIQKIAADELPYISLYDQANIAVMRKNIDGFEMDPWGFLLSVPKMSIGK